MLNISALVWFSCQNSLKDINIRIITTVFELMYLRKAFFLFLIKKSFKSLLSLVAQVMELYKRKSTSIPVNKISKLGAWYLMRGTGLNKKGLTYVGTHVHSYRDYILIFKIKGIRFKIIQLSFLNHFLISFFVTSK